MALVLTDDQQILKRTAADFVKKESPATRVRQLRDAQDPIGFSRELWAKMAALGWQAILIPESYGGLGLGYADMACVLEECGRQLVPEPLLSTVLLGANSVLLAGSESQKQEVLPAVADGSLLLALAYHEQRSRYELAKVETTAVERGGGYVLNGEKTLVWDGHIADRLVVSARTSAGANGISLFLVDRETPGIRIERQKVVHLRNSSLVRLDEVEVAADCMLGTAGSGLPVLEDVIDRATVGPNVAVAEQFTPGAGTGAGFQIPVQWQRPVRLERAHESLGSGAGGDHRHNDQGKPDAGKYVPDRQGGRAGSRGG
jgi:alkylation response protein AidB-like acyl-CoA dehydrogenase